MLKRVLITCTCLVAGLLGAAEEPIDTIKVLIADGVQDPIVEVTGGYRIFNPATQRYIGSGLRGKRYVVEAKETGVKWGEEFPGVYQISIMPRKESTSIVVEGTPYQGAIHLYEIDNRISIVNEVPIEDYLKVTLSEHFREPKSAEVMNAVAIAARTHATYDAEKRKGAFWHVRADEVGYHHGASAPLSPSVAAAVDETQYMVMVAGDRPGHAFPAVWCENCAGTTVPYEVMYGTNGLEGLAGVEAPLALRDRAYVAWRVGVPQEWLARTARLNHISNMSLFVDPPSNKVYAMRLTDGERVQDISFLVLQEAVGPDKLRSSDFTAELKDGQVIFTGHGDGHGVGLCLYSSQYMARNGKNAADMLTAFYPGSRLVITDKAKR